MDVLTPEQRHKNMSHIKGTDNKSEKAIRSQLFKYGFRFRKNDKRYDGKPDIVLPRFHAMIFINGCFWHMHNCPKFVLPKTNTEFWRNKLKKNQMRDNENIKKLTETGWRVAIVWECSISGKNRKSKIEEVTNQLSYWLDERPDETFWEI